MKRIKIYLLLLIGALTASCSALELAPEDNYAINNYWNTAAQTERFVIGLHGRVRDRAENFYLLGELRGGQFNTASITSIGQSANNIEVVSNSLSVTHPGMSNWGNFYMDLYQINHAIDKISNACPFLSDDTRKEYLGMLYGMRAFYYFQMLRTWGGVPLCDKPDVLMTGVIAELRKPRATEQQTWQFIREDIDRSCEMYAALPFGNFKAKNCYWNKAASYSLKAEIYLWGAKVKPLKGSTVFTSTPEQDLQAAKTALTEVEAKYTYNAKFSDAHSSINKDANKETIFAVRYKLGEKTSFYGQFTYNIDVFTAYLDKTGKPLGNIFNIGSGALSYEYSKRFYDTFSDQDTRKDVTFMQFYEKDNDNNIIPKGRSLRKFVYEGEKGADGRVQYTKDYVVYRYMDIALMLAEINNELAEQTEVKRWIEVVRKRAYGAANMPVFTYMSKEAAEEAILGERAAEFVGEGKLWYDVRRMLGGKYALELVEGKELKLVWPIDSGVLSKDNLVKQNEGYL